MDKYRTKIKDNLRLVKLLEEYRVYLNKLPDESTTDILIDSFQETE